MSDAGPLDAKTQAYRNRVTVLVIGGIVGTLATIYVLLLPGVAGNLGALCAVAFLAVAFVGWEYLMKPGYGLRRRMESRSEEPEDPDSPRAP